MNRARRAAATGVAGLLAVAGGFWGASAIFGGDESDRGTVAAPSDATTTSEDPAPPAAESTPEPTPTPSPEPTPEPEPVVFTIMTAGDVLPHATVNRNASLGDGTYDYAPMMEGVRPYIEGADLALCSLEVPLAPPGEEVSAYPVFGAPEELISSLQAVGWDGCATATNHSLDRKVAGLEYTLDVMDQLGMGHTGTGRTPEETVSAQFYEVTKDGATLTVAHLSATTFHNDYTDPSQYSASLHALDADQIDALAAEATAAGADIVLFTPHWGQEYWDSPDGLQQEIAAALAAGGNVDVVLGGHAHVPQPLEFLEGGVDGQGMWTGFSMGNFLSNQDEKCCDVSTATGLLVRTEVTLDPATGEARVTSVTWSGETVDTEGRQRLYPIQSLVDGATAPELTLSSTRIATRYAELLDVMGDANYDPTPPTPGGAVVTVVPRS